MCVHPYIKEINGVLTPLPCGRCIECRRKYTLDWVFRLNQHAFYHPNYWFITLTYNDDNLPCYEEINFRTGKKQHYSCVIKSEVQNFIKRLRKALPGAKMSYFAVGEYGKNNRAHYHLILFYDGWKNVHQAYLDVLRSWTVDCINKGFVYVKRGLKQHIHYLAKYVNKLDYRVHVAPPFKLMSKGLGIDFLSTKLINWFWTTCQLKVYYDKDKFIPLPRYYRKKLDEYGTINGLTLTQYAAIITPITEYDEYSSKWYHSYFCRNFDDIFSAFKSYLRLHCIDYCYPDETINTCFDWYLNMNKVTRDSIFESNRRLSEVRLKHRLDIDYCDIGSVESFYDEINYLHPLTFS